MNGRVASGNSCTFIYCYCIFHMYFISYVYFVYKNAVMNAILVHYFKRLDVITTTQACPSVVFRVYHILVNVWLWSDNKMIIIIIILTEVLTIQYIHLSKLIVSLLRVYVIFMYKNLFFNFVSNQLLQKRRLLLIPLTQ